MNVSLPHCLKMLNVRFPHFLLSALNEAASLWAEYFKKNFKKNSGNICIFGNYFVSL